MSSSQAELGTSICFKDSLLSSEAGMTMTRK